MEKKYEEGGSSSGVSGGKKVKGAVVGGTSATQVTDYLKKEDSKKEDHGAGSAIPSRPGRCRVPTGVEDARRV